MHLFGLLLNTLFLIVVAILVLGGLGAPIGLNSGSLGADQLRSLFGVAVLIALATMVARQKAAAEQVGPVAVAFLGAAIVVALLPPITITMPTNESGGGGEAEEDRADPEDLSDSSYSEDIRTAFDRSARVPHRQIVSSTGGQSPNWKASRALTNGYGIVRFELSAPQRLRFEVDADFELSAAVFEAETADEIIGGFWLTRAWASADDTLTIERVFAPGAYAFIVTGGGSDDNEGPVEIEISVVSFADMLDRAPDDQKIELFVGSLPTIKNDVVPVGSGKLTYVVKVGSQLGDDPTCLLISATTTTENGDPYLTLLNGDELQVRPLAEDDDGGEGLNSKLVLPLNQPGDQFVIPSRMFLEVENLSSNAMDVQLRMQLQQDKEETGCAFVDFELGNSNAASPGTPQANEVQDGTPPPTDVVAPQPSSE